MNDVAAMDLTRTNPLLPDDFVFSQSSLQTFVDCKRRFWLTYLNRVPWPSAPASPAGEFERLMRLGATFHRMVQRAEERIESDDVGEQLDFPLASWYRAYRENRPADLPVDAAEHKLTEYALEAMVEVEGRPYRLMAKYDLLASVDNRTMIVDWKTAAKATRPLILQQKMQTTVYPFVLAEAGDALPWGPVEPNDIEMRYWFTAAPQQPVVFRYDSAKHAGGAARILELIGQIVASADEDDYPKTPDTEFARKYTCGFCAYRSYCDRGDKAADLAELDDFAIDDLADAASYLDFSLDDVEEIPH